MAYLSVHHCSLSLSKGCSGIYKITFLAGFDKLNERHNCE
jgi:hypothetical protein